MREGPYVGQISVRSPKGCSETSTVCSIAKFCVRRIYVFVREIVYGRFDGLDRHLALSVAHWHTWVWRRMTDCHVIKSIGEKENGAIHLVSTRLTDSQQWPHVLPLLLQILSMYPLSSMTLLSTRSLSRTRSARTTASSSQPSRISSRPSTSLSAVVASQHPPLLHPNRRR